MNETDLLREDLPSPEGPDRKGIHGWLHVSPGGPFCASVFLGGPSLGVVELDISTNIGRMWAGALKEEPAPKTVEELAAKFHDIYQQEAKRQGDVRHKDAYADLSENIKEFDRVLARYVIRQQEQAVHAAFERGYKAGKDGAVVTRN